MDKQIFFCGDTDIDKRLDIFLCEKIGTPRNGIQKMIGEKFVFINGVNKNKNYKLRKDDEIQIQIKEDKPLDVVAQNIPIDIVYEDEHIVIVNKVQGMVVHPSNGHTDNTLVNALMHHCKDSLSSINGVIRPGIVHRIDKDTSGILMIAKNNNAHIKLAKQLEEHTIKREYYAVVYNNIKNDTGKIDKPIGRDNKDRKKMAINDKNGKRAVTNYTVIERYGKYTLVKLRLETGRTHQIRVHMTSIGHPILGDTVYGAKKHILGLKTQTLHAKTLGFIHPYTNEYIEFDTELPLYFKKVLANMR